MKEGVMLIKFFMLSSYFELLFCYFDLNTQVNSEYFILDISSVLTNVGGNVGLFLGYSLMTFLLGLFETFKLLRRRFKENQETILKKEDLTTQSIQ